MRISEEKKLMLIGEVGKPHGRKGEVRVLPLTDNPQHLNSLKQVYLIKPPANPVLYEIQGVRYNKALAIVKFSGCDSRAAASALIGARLGISRPECPPLPEGSYYYFDIIGLETYTPQGEYLGKIEAIISTGSNDVYVVRSSSGGEILVPAVREVVAEVDLERGRMIVQPVEGLIDPRVSNPRGGNPRVGNLRGGNSDAV